MGDQKTLLLKILDATGFDGNKEMYAQMVMDLIMEDTVYKLIHSLPETKQDKIARKWDNNADNHAAMVSILRHYFTPEEIAKATEASASHAIMQYIRSIEDTLDDVKKEKLRQLAEQFVPNN